jgi:heme-degrading monooxygenase HmoA
MQRGDGIELLEGRAMIARIWRGVVAAADTDAYAEYMLETGVRGYRSTPGNRGVYMLRRISDPECEFLMVSLWNSIDDARAFAGDDVEQAVFYPEDDRFLVDRDLRVRHYEVVGRAGDLA